MLLRSMLLTSGIVVKPNQIRGSSRRALLSRLQANNSSAARNTCQAAAVPRNTSTVSPQSQRFTTSSTNQLSHSRAVGCTHQQLALPLAGAVGQLLSLLPANMGAQSQPPLSLEETLQAVVVPPIERNLGPRVEHIYVAEPGLLSDAIVSALGLPQWFVLELIRFGAVHCCPVMPQPSPKAAPRMSQQHLERMQKLRAAGIAKHGKSPALQVPRRAAADCQLQEGAYVRVHVHPKRFPAAYTVDWRQCVLADRPEYVVVDKPAGVQVPPTVDNMLESVVSLTAAALGLPPDGLLNTHRLDVGTSGLVVLARSPAFASWFSALLKNKPDTFVKTYRCLTAAPPPCGPMVHWAVVEQRAAGEPAHTRMLPQCGVPDAHSSSSSSSDGGSSEAVGGGTTARQAAVEGAARCELIVEQVEQVTLTGRAAREWGPTAYETTLQLVTGRTHQIRAQMAAVGCPLLGDQLYTALAALWKQGQHLVQQGIETSQPQDLQQQQQQQQQQVQPLAGGQEEQQQPPPPQQQQEQHPQPQSQQQQDQQHQQQAQGDAQLAGQHRHSGAHWSKVYQEDPSRPIGLQAAKLRIRNVDGRMTTGGGSAAASAGAGTAEVLLREEQGVGQAGAADEQKPEPEWVEFEAGTPWWRL